MDHQLKGNIHRYGNSLWILILLGEMHTVSKVILACGSALLLEIKKQHDVSHREAGEEMALGLCTHWKAFRLVSRLL